MGDRFTRDLCGVVGSGPGPDELAGVVSRAVAPWVPHDALRLVGTSPAIGLGLGSMSFWDRYEAGLRRALVIDRFRGHERSGGRTGSRARDGGGRPAWTMRQVLAAHGAGSELRLVLRDSRGVWGLLGLLRSEGGRQFDGVDAERVAQLGPGLLAALRTVVAGCPLVPSIPALPAGVIIVGPDHAIRWITPQAQAWLDQMWIPRAGGLPGWITETFTAGLSSSARKRARDPSVWRPLICSTPVIFQRWVALEGQLIGDADDGDVAVVVQAASRDLLLPSFCDWYGITPRERHVVELLPIGMAPKQIARHLNLSLYTVNDHLRAVYRKTNAEGRDHLTAALTA